MPASVPAHQVIEVFECATEENQVSHLRHHQVVDLPAEGEVFLAGDIHDNRRNFDKLLRLADLANHPGRHVVLQELIHGDMVDEAGAEGSWEILYRAAALKCDHPSQVHFLLANHDLAQIHGEGIMKAGVSVCESFKKGIKRDFADKRYNVEIAITEFLLSFPLAVRCANGLFFCHSLPTDEQVDKFDYTVFDRALTGPDYARRTGPVYQLVWGRNTSPSAADRFAERVGASVCVTGHQPQESGYYTNGEHQLIIASEHNQGVFLQADLTQQYNMDSLVERVTKFVAVDV